MIEPQIQRLLRLKQILGDPKADPPVEPIIPISKSSWWDGISKGKYPKPIKLGENTTVWREDDIRKFIDGLEFCIFRIHKHTNAQKSFNLRLTICCSVASLERSFL